MNTDGIIELVAAVSILVCLLFSIILTLQKNQRVDRALPLLWQIVFWWFTFGSFDHGFPGEKFKMMIFGFLWSIIALIISNRLLRIHTWRSRVFAWSQITQVITLIYLAVLAYVSSCWRHYGHIVWNP
ncbi:MAG TPA: hypothetical protein VGO57_09335 [Verrucomicrobiae bacterium]|jgi:hypothetical protein